ncbi:uncharacterized protein C1orf131 homolog [Gymnodraco acuticeps]|uniref:Uncharacterized protein C1orf131 homolog n=1 Tax=Gymnodraco acuticeps TaxID=8218 RepID=A0A6P8SYI9_GYMAC|nr:uncharacterized protein C1orf131 homolog [Gymnodraco acuticeps]
MNGKEDEDCLFLENILDKLYEFDYGPASKKKHKSQKKNKRKRCEEEEKEVHDVRSDSEDADHVGTDKQQQVQREQPGPAIQPASKVEVVTFQDPRKKPRIKQKPPSDKKPAPQKITEEKESDQPEELSLEKARLEVHRFGITGYKKEQQRVFEQDRAVMLGARPPKKEYTNYKMLQQQIKDKKQKAREEVQPELKKKKKTSNPRDKKKRVSSGSRSEPSGQVGRFKNGMLILSSKEIQNVKGNKKRK